MNVVTSGVGNPQATNLQPTARTQENPGQTSAGKQGVSPEKDTAQKKNIEQTQDVVQLGKSASLKSLGAANSIESFQNKMNQLAIETKITREALDTTTAAIGRMDAIFVKNFPPFPKDNPERRDALMSYASIAKEINKMTVPPPPPPVYQKVQSEWETLFTADGKINPDAIPSLDISSTGAEIDTARTTLSETSVQMRFLKDSLNKAVQA